MRKCVVKVIDDRSLSRSVAACGYLHMVHSVTVLFFSTDPLRAKQKKEKIMTQEFLSLMNTRGKGIGNL